MTALVQDVAHAMRALARRPGFALVVTLTFALGIGASTAIVSAVYPILFAPLPYPDASRLVAIWDIDAEGEPFEVTYGTHVEIVERSRSFDSLAVASRWRPSLAGDLEPERLDGHRVSVDYFRVLGVPPALGRSFTEDEAAPGGASVAIVGARLARRLTGEPEAALGSTILLDGEPHTVIGVMPEMFENVLSPQAEVWAPLQYRERAPFETAEWGHHLRLLGRLSAGVSADQARRDLASIASSPLAEFSRPPWASMGNGLLVEPLQAAVTATIRPVLWSVLGAVFLLLAIASVNVANLLLARGAECSREIATRAALGASPGRVLRERLTESLVLAVLGGIAGLGVAIAGVRAFVALAPPGLPRLDAIALDGPVFVIALATTSVVGLTVGLPPAFQAMRTNLRMSLQNGVRAIGHGRHTLRRALVVAQVALALVLLVGAGLLLRSMERILATTPGFEASRVLTMQVVATGHRFASNDEALQLFEQTLEAVRNVPGVTHAAYTSQLPLSGDADLYGAAFESMSTTDERNSGGAVRYAVTPAWFRTMGIPLVQGRLLDANDRQPAPVAVLINESFAKRRFGDRSPIGERVRFGPQINDPSGSWSTIVGVVGDVRHSSLALPPPDAFYVTMGHWNWVDDTQTLAVRTDGDPLALVTAVKRAIWSVAPSVPVVRVETMAGMLSASESRRTFTLMVFSLFAAAALALATLGLYGVVAGNVAERNREIGLRSALGATHYRIVRLVLRQGMTLAIAGVALGIIGAAAAGRGLAALIFGVDWLDVPTYVAVSLLLIATAAFASWLPARRAARLDPTATLRSE